MQRQRKEQSRKTLPCLNTVISSVYFLYVFEGNLVPLLVQGVNSGSRLSAGEAHLRVSYIIQKRGSSNARLTGKCGWTAWPWRLWA